MSIARITEMMETRMLQAFSGSSNLTNQACTRANSIVVFNDGASDVVVTIGGITWTVKSGDLPFDEMLPAFTQFSVTASTAFRIYTRG